MAEQAAVETSPEFSSPSPLSPIVPNQTKQSYASAVSTRPSLRKHDFEVIVIDGEPTIDVPANLTTEPNHLWQDYLIGRFPNSAPHVAKIHVIVNKIWTLGNKSIKIDVFEINATSVKFRIRDSSTRQRVLRRSMWNIAGQPMLLSKWSPNPEDTQPEIQNLPMWITLKNVPQDMFSWDGLGFLSSPVGHPIRLHPETILCNSFDEAKVFVDVNLKQDLPQRFRFRIGDSFSVVEYEYPWLPPRCSCCSKWGHIAETCIANQSGSAKLMEKNTEEIEEGEVVLEQEQSLEVDSHIATAAQEKEIPTMSSSSVPEVDATSSSGKKEDIWLKVSPRKGSRSGEQKCPTLKFGEVTLVSRFAALEDTEVNTSLNVPDFASAEETDEAVKDMVTAEESDNPPAKDLGQSASFPATDSEDKQAGIRPSLPRSTKQRDQKNTPTQTAKRNPSILNKSHSRRHR